MTVHDLPYWRRVDWNDPTTFPPDGLYVRMFRSVRYSHRGAWAGLARSYHTGDERHVSVTPDTPIDLGDWDDDNDLPPYPDIRPLDLPHHTDSHGHPLDTVWWRPA